MRRLVPVLLLASLPFAVQAADTSRILQSVSPAAELKQVTLDAGVGQLKVSASPDDSVHVQVRLEKKSQNFLWFFHWMSQSTTKAISQVTLQQQSQGDSVTYTLKYPDHLDDGGIKQNWDVQVPSRLFTKVTMKVGQLSVNGIAGGVDVSLNVGEVILNTSAGSMKARVNVGQIRATSATAQPGNIRLSTTIGDARLSMKGRVDRDNMHHNGLGRTIDVTGNGPDQMDLELNIGEVSLHIGPKQTEDKTP
jgi:YbbR domain-containing protein